MANGGIDSTLVIAIYGAVVATAVFLFDMFKYFNEKPNVAVKTTFSLFYESGDLKKEKKKIAIGIINSVKVHKGTGGQVLQYHISKVETGMGSGGTVKRCKRAVISWG
jgi:hypothetical protein